MADLGPVPAIDDRLGDMVLHARGRAVVLVVVVALLALAGCTSSSTPSAAPHVSPLSVRPLPRPPSSAATNPVPASAAKRPNIVFVLTDDLSENLVQYMPHVLAMEKAGSTLSNYYVVDSLCCPSRTAILTGEYPHDDGVFTNTGSDGGYGTFNRHGNVANTYGVALQRAGYRTGFMGKYLNGYSPTYAEPAGWDEWDVAGLGYHEFDYQLDENGTRRTYGHQPADYLTDVLSHKATTFIDQAAGKGPARKGARGRPFALEIATFAPHKPSTPAPRDAHSFPGLTAPRGPAYDKEPTDPPPWLAKIPPLSARDERSIDTKFRLRVQAVQAVDRMIGRVEAELKATGQADNTYFVFSSDNGYHMGDYRLRPGKQTAFDTDIHVPLVVTGPGVPAGRSVPDLASSIDLAPTFEALAGARPPRSTDGTSLVPLWHGQAPPVPQTAVLIEHHGPDTNPSDPDYPPRLSGNPPSYEAVRTASALYVRYDDGEREYYDTATDPYELHNLATTAPAAVLAPLQRALAALSTCHGAAACQAAARLG